MGVRFLYLFLIAPFSPALAAAGGDPGLVVVIGETPESVAFQVPGSSPYKFQYELDLGCPGEYYLHFARAVK